MLFRGAYCVFVFFNQQLSQSSNLLFGITICFISCLLYSKCSLLKILHCQIKLVNFSLSIFFLQCSNCIHFQTKVLEPHGIYRNYMFSFNRSHIHCTHCWCQTSIQKCPFWCLSSMAETHYTMFMCWFCELSLKYIYKRGWNVSFLRHTLMRARSSSTVVLSCSTL